MPDFPLDPINFITFMGSMITNKMHTREFEGKKIEYLPDEEFLELSTNIPAWLEYLENIDIYFRRLFANDPTLKDDVARKRCKIVLIGVYSKFGPKSLANVISTERVLINCGDATPPCVPDGLISEDELRKYNESLPLFLPVKFVRGIYSQDISAEDFVLIEGIANENK